jgi:LysR family transcriptional regulator, nitrogen assimilation regulatory protein
MDLKQLRGLLTIAETGNVTRASDILHIVQPALSRQIKLLEEELGVTLFDRERHGMVLTPVGRKFAERVRGALRELDAAKDEVRPRKDQLTGDVNVGFLPSAADLLVGNLMARMRHSHPGVRVRSHVAYVAELQLGLEQGEIDIALMFLPSEQATQLPGVAILEEQFFLVGTADAGLDMDTPISLAGLDGRPMILPSTSTSLRTMVVNACEAAGVSLNIVAEAAALHLHKSLVLEGIGLSILSGAMIRDELARGLLTACPIDSFDFRRRLYLVRTPRRALSPAAVQTQEALRAIACQQVTNGSWPGATILPGATAAR